MESWSSKLDLRALADRYGSPLYLHHRSTLERNFHDYVRLVGDPGHVRFPVKANPSPVVLRALAGWGSGADCASGPEVRAALDAGIPAPLISYTTPAMDLRLARWLLEEGATVVLDSITAFEELGSRWDDSWPGRVFLRVNPGALPGYRREEDFQRFTAHGAASSQFGIPSERIVDLLRSGREPGEMAVTGLHVHVGTMMDNLETFVAGLEYLHTLADLVGDQTGHRIATLNLGGGLGQPHLPEQDFPTIASFAATLGDYLRDDVEYHVEPGNSLVGDSFGLLTTLVSMKESRDRRWGICDVGTDQLVKHTVARWLHQIVDADGRELPAEGDDALAGPLCFAGDVLLPSTDLGDLKAGDPLLVRHAGAYCEAIASRFNGRLSPPTVVLSDDDEPSLERRREDAFFEPMSQSYRPPRLAGGGAINTTINTTIDTNRITALQSEYMHRLAEDEGYEIVGSTALGSSAYAFEIAPRAPVGFVAMPLALRIVGDASIVAVGLELGWNRKESPVWAGRLSLTVTELLRQNGSIPCRVVVSHLSPGTKDGIAHRGHVHFELGGDAEVRGMAQVSVEAVSSP